MPSRVSRVSRRARDQHAQLGRIKHHGVSVVAGRGDHLPVEFPHFHCDPAAEAVVIPEALGALIGDREDQRLLVPAIDERRLAHRDAGSAAVFPLDRGVAPHVIGVAVRVDEPRKRSSLQGVLEQRQRLCRVRTVAGVDERRAALRVQHDVVGRQPPALDDLDARGQVHSCALLTGKRASTVRFSSVLMPDQAAISASVRKQPSHSSVSGFIRHTLLHGEATSAPGPALSFMR